MLTWADPLPVQSVRVIYAPGLPSPCPLRYVTGSLLLQDLIAPGIALGFYLSIYNKNLIDINALFIRACKLGPYYLTV